MKLEEGVRPDPVGELIRQLGWAENSSKDSPYKAQSLSQKLLDLSFKREVDHIDKTFSPGKHEDSTDIDASSKLESILESVQRSDRFFDALERRESGIISFPGINVEDVASSVSFTLDGDIHLQLKINGAWKNYSLLSGEFFDRDAGSESLPPAENLEKNSEQFIGPGGEMLTITRIKDSAPLVSLNI